MWLPAWAIERARRAAPDAVPAATPLALVESGRHGIRIAAVNEAAGAAGIRRGERLADARARLPALVTRSAEPVRDRAALRRLARWAGRYGPARNIDATADGEGGRIVDGLWIDTTGVAHLYGGEAALAADLVARLAGFGLTARVAIADTRGAAHALARYAADARRGPVIAPAGGNRAALAALPVAALQLAPDALVLLRRLGLKRIGQLYDLPRAALARRFPSSVTADAVLARLDKALGLAAEPRRALAEPALLEVRHAWPEPIAAAEVVTAETARLADRLGALLVEAGLGARRIRLSLYRADGTLAEIEAATSAPSAEGCHLMALVAERLNAIDAGFGVDVLVLAALTAERVAATQAALVAPSPEAPLADPAHIVDRLANRLGAARVLRLEGRASHIPERAEARVPAIASLRTTSVGIPPPSGRARGQAASAESSSTPSPSPRGGGESGCRSPRGVPSPSWPGGGDGRSSPEGEIHDAVSRRPPLLLARPEPIGVVAEVPEGPPMRFTWRRREHRVVKAEGPERIAPEWWRLLATGSALPAGSDPPGLTPCRASGFPPPRPSGFPPPPTPPREGEGRSGALSRPFPPGGGESAPLSLVAHPTPLAGGRPDAPASGALAPGRRTRDYYRIEDAGGGRFWVFRDGLYGDDDPPRWFLHGLFG